MEYDANIPRAYAKENTNVRCRAIVARKKNSYITTAVVVIAAVTAATKNIVVKAEGDTKRAQHKHQPKNKTTREERRGEERKLAQ